MRYYLIAGACAAAMLSSSVSAQSRDLFRTAADLVGTAITTSKQRKTLAQLSQPLVYEEAEGPRDPGNRQDPRNFDIAGVRIGMTVREAQSALRGAGYVDDGPRTDQPSYAGEVMSAWQIQYGVGPGTNDRTTRELVWKKGEEQITVALIALPEGPRVSSVSYGMQEGRPISRDEFARRVLAKYGEPVNDNPEELRWCTVKAPECEHPFEVEYPQLTAHPKARSMQLSGNDPGLKEGLKRRFAADVESRKPTDRAPSF